jgi:hypothetical protein
VSILNKLSEQGSETIPVKELMARLNGTGSGSLSQRYENNEVTAMLMELQRENKVSIIIIITIIFIR